jgi:hypothetical protein
MMTCKVACSHGFSRGKATEVATITLDPEFSDTLEGNTVTLLLVCLTFGIRITSLPFGNNRATRNV